MEPDTGGGKLHTVLVHPGKRRIGLSGRPLLPWFRGYQPGQAGLCAGAGASGLSGGLLFSSGEDIPAQSFHIPMNVGHDPFASVYGFDLIDATKSYPGDVLFFHGDQDDLVPISYSERAVSAYPNAVLEVLHNEGHLYSSGAFRQTIESVSDFFCAHLDQPMQTGLFAEQILSGADGDIHYSYYLAESYDGSRKIPLMLVLPGYDRMWFGENSSGSSLDWNGFTSWTKLDTEMIPVSAQPEDWGERSARQAIELTEYFLDSFAVDANRIYAAGYSAGGETLSRAVSMRPDLYAAYLHAASQWDGDYAPIARNGVAVYICMADDDEYYGSARARSAYKNLRTSHENAGWNDERIDRVLRIETPDRSFFNAKGIYHYHSANVVFDDPDNLNWDISHSKG